MTNKELEEIIMSNKGYIEDRILEAWYNSDLKNLFEREFSELEDYEKHALRESFGFWKYCVRLYFQYFLIQVINQLKKNLAEIRFLFKSKL